MVEICPTGWTIPSSEQWNTMISVISASNGSAHKLNGSGFNPINGGYRRGESPFTTNDINNYGYYWSYPVDMYDNTRYYFNLGNQDGLGTNMDQGVSLEDAFGRGHSIRCIQED